MKKLYLIILICLNLFSNIKLGLTDTQQTKPNNNTQIQEIQQLTKLNQHFQELKLTHKCKQSATRACWRSIIYTPILHGIYCMIKQHNDKTKDQIKQIHETYISITNKLENRLQRENY
jgi:hypothetical protein